MSATYILKYKTGTHESIAQDIERLGGKIEYRSPVLPILAFTGHKQIGEDIKSAYDLEYITESPENGSLLDEGALTSHFMPIQFIPKVDFSKPRSLGLAGWGITVAVLDGGASEEWIKEHFDFTGTGSAPSVPHGNRVVNILKRFSRGSQLVSCKVAKNYHDVEVLDVLRGIDFAVNQLQAPIINMSLGFIMKDPCSGSECALCEHVNVYSQTKGTTFIVAAGNDGGEGTVRCPGKAQEAITVGSITQMGTEVAQYSGKSVQGGTKPNILCTGSFLFDREYDEGTSYSTPIVSGVFAAILSGNKHEPSVIRNQMYATAKDIGWPSHHQGFGVLQIDRLLEVLSYGEGTGQNEGQNES